MTKGNVTVRQADVSIAETEIAIQSDALADELASEREATVGFLSDQVAPLALADISLDDAGQVVVRNKVFVDRAREKIDQGLNLTDAAGEVGC